MSEAGAQEAARKVGELVLPVGREAAWHVAKVLKAAKRDLYCAPGSGRRYGEVLEHHLTNLILAIGCGAPKDAVHTVDTFNALRRRRGNYVEYFGGVAVCLGPTLGEAVATIIRAYAVEAWEDVEVRLILALEPKPCAELCITHGIVHRLIEFTENGGHADLESATLTRTFTNLAFEALAEILNATRGRPDATNKPDSEIIHRKDLGETDFSGISTEIPIGPTAPISSSHAIRAISDAARVPYPTVERMTRPLKQAGRWVQRGDRELRPHHLVSLIAGFAARHPGDALRAAEAYADQVEAVIADAASLPDDFSLCLFEPGAPMDGVRRCVVLHRPVFSAAANLLAIHAGSSK